MRIAYDFEGGSLSYSREDIPLYRGVPERDFLVVGTEHKQRINRHPIKRYRFLKRLKGNEHLMMESTKKMLELTRKYHDSDNVETLAAKKHQGSVHYLEDGAGFNEIAKKYGFRTDLRGLYIIGEDIFGISNRQQLYLQLLLERMVNPEQFTERDVRNSINQFDRLIHEAILPRRMTHAEFRLVSKIYKHFRNLVREQEILAPRSAELVSSLSGGKIAIMGANHVDFVVGMVNGEPERQLCSWPEYKDKLEKPRYKDIFERIENDIFPPEQSNVLDID